MCTPLQIPSEQFNYLTEVVSITSKMPSESFDTRKNLEEVPSSSYIYCKSIRSITTPLYCDIETDGMQIKAKHVDQIHAHTEEPLKKIIF